MVFPTADCGYHPLMIRQTLCVAVASVMIASPLMVWAQGLESGAPAMAEQRYQLARSLYREGRLDQALQEFKSALDLFPRSTKLAFNIARVAERLGKLDVAAKHYRLYLTLAPAAEDRAQVQQLVDSLERRLQAERPELVISTAPAKANVYLDADSAPTGSTPLRIRVAPGTHAVRIVLEGYEPVMRSVNVEKGKAAALAIQLSKARTSAAPVSKAPVNTPTAVEPADIADRSGGMSRTLGWVAIGLGGALVAYGAYSGVQAADSAGATVDTGDQARYEALQSDIDSQNLGMGIGLGLGLVFAGVGTGLLLFSGGDGATAVAPSRNGALVEVRF